MTTDLKKEHEELWYAVFEIYLEGICTPSGIFREITKDMQISEEEQANLCETLPGLIRQILDDGHFMQEVKTAKTDAPAAAVARIKRKLHAHVRQMEKLSQSKDARVSFSATQDLLNRGETGPKQKAEGPGAWIEAMKAQGLLKEEK